MRKLITALACVCLLLTVSYEGNASALFKKKKKAKTVQKDTVQKKKISKYDKTFIKDKKCVTARSDSGLISLHKLKGKLYIEMSRKALGHKMLIASTISGSSSADLASIGYKPTNPLYVRFILRDSTVFLTEVNILPDYDTLNKAMSKAVRLNSMDPVLHSFPLTCYNNDSSAVVFDASSLFVGNNDKLAPLKSGTTAGVNMTVSYNSGGSSLGEIKAFRDNVTIKSMLSYNVSANYMQMVSLKQNEPMTVSVTRTILLLPDKTMRPRLADSRVGIFQTGRVDLEPDEDKVLRYSVIKRWDIQPSDTSAWLSGKMVEPVKPIVFYLDDAFPESWRGPVKRAALRWNAAFEEIGFKNTIQVKGFPKDEPEFDPDNLKYSCIRYVPAMTQNAMGPSWCDPSTGEIINASVIVYNDVIKLINTWRFCQTAQVDPKARGKRMPEDVMQESIEYVLAHEIGHTLGFMHNMSASAAYPVDSLRSPLFTKKYGTTASIMDYARFNYVAQPEDKGVALTPPMLGPYDYFLVKYAYKPIPEAKTMREEASVLESWVEEKASDKKFRYGRQQVLYRYDPSALEEDLGDDPIKASEYGVKNLKYILSHFNEWMPDEADPDAVLREERYEALAKQYNRYIKAVMMNIGGIYLKDVRAGQPDKNAAPVDKARQRAALKWVLAQLKDCSWIANKEITDRFSLRVELPNIITYYTALELFNTYLNVMLSSHLAENLRNAYTLRNWADDMYEGVWESAIKNRKLSTGDKILQNLYLDFLTGIVTKKTTLLKVGGTSLSSAYLPSADHIAAFGLYENSMLDENIDLLRALDEEKGQGYVALNMLDSFGKPGNNWQYRVNLRTIDDSKTVFFGEVQKIEKLLKAAAAKSSGEDRVHYQAALYNLEYALYSKK